MTNHNLDPAAAERAETARKRVQQYLALEALHETVGGFDNEGDAVEGKNT